MMFNRYPDISPKNDQKIVYFLNSLTSDIGVFKDDEDEWSGETYPRICYISVKDKKFYWIDYDTIANLVL